MPDKPKVVGSVVISIAEDNTIQITTNVESKVDLRDILKTAEELVIREALIKTTEKPSNIVSLQQVN